MSIVKILYNQSTNILAIHDLYYVAVKLKIIST